MTLSNAKNAPKVATVSNEKRGDNMEKPTQVTVEGSLSLSRAKEAHANAQTLVSNEQRAKGMEKNAQVADFATTTQMMAPKVATVNDQVRGEMAGQRNAQVADFATTTQMMAPKVATVNDQVRGEMAGQRNAQVADMRTQNAMSKFVGNERLHINV